MPQLSLQLNLQQYIDVRLVCTASGPLGLLLLPTSSYNIHIHAFFCKILSYCNLSFFIIWHQRINRGEKRLTLLLDFCILSYLRLSLAVWRLLLCRLCLFLSPYFPPFSLLSELHSEPRHRQPAFPEYGMETYIYNI